MKPISVFLVAVTLLISGCEAPPNQRLISATPASSQQFSEAKSAAAVCGRHAPNWVAASAELKADGYVETKDPRLASVRRAVILEKSGTDVIVLLGSEGKERACIVGLEGMTPQQSFELAQPWVQKFDAQTNAERGQGLAKDAVQAWGKIEENRNIFIAAFKTWDVLEGPGAAARLFFIQR